MGPLHRIQRGLTATRTDRPRLSARQIRSLVLYVGLVGFRRIWPAHVGCLVGPDGSRRIPSDRLDDQTDDQARATRRPRSLRRRQGLWSGHQTFHLVAPGGTATRAPEPSAIIGPILSAVLLLAVW